MGSSQRCGFPSVGLNTPRKRLIESCLSASVRQEVHLTPGTLQSTSSFRHQLVYVSSSQSVYFPWHDFYRDLWVSTTIMKLPLDLNFCHTWGWYQYCLFPWLLSQGAEAAALLRRLCRSKTSCGLPPLHVYMYAWSMCLYWRVWHMMNLLQFT